MKRTFFTGAIVLAFISLATAANFWNKKPYTQWSRSDAIQMLTDSPWAKSTLLHSSYGSSRTVAGVQGVEDSRTEPMVRYAVTLRSAMPIRQANVRMAAIADKYDNMDPAGRQEFDNKWSKYLQMAYANAVVVEVNYGSNLPSLDRELVTYFQAQKLETIAESTSLILPDGKKLQPIGFESAPHLFVLAFPRPSGLAPNSSFTVVFQHPGITDYAAQSITATYSLKEMGFDGAPAF
ncbi:MAG: hypothetical protein ACRD3E_16885 [Terriglobales bacterium]